MKNDVFWMREAILEALKTRRFFEGSGARDDVPVGAVIVLQNQVLSRAHNQRELLSDPTAHAEILAIRAACASLGSRHLESATLFVTLEPCAMCAGAIWLSRISRVVFGAFDVKAGACGSVFDIPRDPRLNHRPQLRGGVLETECATLLRDFFERKRGKSRTQNG